MARIQKLVGATQNGAVPTAWPELAAGTSLRGSAAAAARTNPRRKRPLESSPRRSAVIWFMPATLAWNSVSRAPGKTPALKPQRASFVVVGHLKLGVVVTSVRHPRSLKVRLLGLQIFIALAILLPPPALADWSHDLGGQIPFEHFTKAQIATNGPFQGAIVHPRGKLLVKGDQLAVFDGSAWQNYPVPGGTVLRSLAVDPSGRVWAGAIDEIGYFDEEDDGSYVFRSLRDRLPEEEREFQDAWGCGVVEGQVFFVCRNRVLQWDGAAFRVWQFPTARKLVPVKIGSEFWFTHAETGMYRLGPSGPEKRFELGALPPREAYWAERQGDGLLLATSKGMFRTGQLAPISDPTLTNFLGENYVVEGLRLATGEIVLATFGGVAVISPDGSTLRRVISRRDGLPSNGLNGVCLDETGHLWITTAEHGMLRFDAANGAALFPSSGAIKSLAQDGDRLIAASENEIAFVALPNPGPSLSLLPGSEARHAAVVPTKHGLISAGFSELRLFMGARYEPILRSNGTTFFDLQPRRGDADRVLSLEGYQLAEIVREPDGNYRHQVLARLTKPANAFVEDASGVVWINSPESRIFLHRPGSTEIQELALPATSVSATPGAQLLRYGEGVVAFFGHEGWMPNPQTGGLTALPALPAGATVVRAVADGSRVHAVVEWRGVRNARSLSLCTLALDGRKEWREWYLPALGAMGAVGGLKLDSVTGDLWVGADRGLLRIRTSLLREAPSLRPLRLRVEGGGVGDLPYAGHRLVVTAESPDLGQRARLAFQSRFISGGKIGDWEEAGGQNVFEFRNLADGKHTIEVRAVDIAGRTTDVAAYQFRVAPPRWRSRAALISYAAALLVGIVALVRIRERSIRARNAELERIVTLRTAELRKANAAKDEFLASMSHEIRNPLNGVVGLAAAIDPRTLQPETRVKFGYLQHCANHLASLLEDILDFSRLEAGGLTLEQRPFDLWSTIHSVAAIVADQSTQAGRHVDVQIAPSVPVWVVGDAARVRQLIINLVINALKYGDRGEVQVTVWATQTLPTHCTVTFAVSDEGAGIPPEELAQLFQRFSRGSAARRRRQAGSGIGLSICKTIADKMGARLWAESEVDQGSTFFLEAPFAVADAPSRQDQKISIQGNVLVVEDEDYNRVALEALLKSLGFSVTMARGGDEALRSAAKTSFAVVFLDYDLPGMTGPEIARHLRSNPLAKDTLIIATTAFVTPDKHAECLQAGMNSVLTKPLTAEKLRQGLSEATSRWQSAPAVQLATERPADAVSVLRELADRKGVAPEEEIRRYVEQLEMQAGELRRAIASREVAPGTRAAHQMVGLLGYAGAEQPVQLARQLERAIGTEQWERVAPLHRALEQEIAELRAGLSNH